MQHIDKPIVAIVVLGCIEYAIDVATSGDLYQACWDLRTQSSILFHHICYLFGLFGWASDNEFMLWLYFFAIPGFFSHWKVNKLKCNWGMKDSKRCGKDFKLRTVGRLLGYEDKGRKFQIAWFLAGWLIASKKLWDITNQSVNFIKGFSKSK